MIQHVKTHAIPCPHQPPTRGDATILVAKVLLSPLVPPAAFATRLGMKTKRFLLSDVFIKVIINDHSIYSLGQNYGASMKNRNYDSNLYI